MSEEEKKSAVVSQPAVVKHTNSLKKAIISDDAKNVKDYVVYDVIVPKAKDLIGDAIKYMVDVIFNGKDGAKRRSSNSGGITKISYNSIYDSGRSVVGVRHDATNVDDIVFASREDAENVLDSMYETLQRYNKVKVSDYYEFCGVTGSYTGNDYGWRSLTGSRIDRRSDGYSLVLPRVECLR